MGMVMFACVCDRCKKRSEEYNTWYRCVECGDDVCKECSTNHDSDVDGATAICNRCAVDVDVAALADALTTKCARCSSTALLKQSSLCAGCDLLDMLDKADHKFGEMSGR